MRSYYKFHLELDSGKEAEIKAYYIISNDGIGPYEFWGQKCNDRGTDFIKIESEEWDKSIYTKEENEEINAKITEDLLEKWAEEISDSFEPPDADADTEDEPYVFLNENEY